MVITNREVASHFNGKPVGEFGNFAENFLRKLFSAYCQSWI